MGLPAFEENGWLPVGHHPVDWQEVVARFGGEPGSRRAALTERLLALCEGLRACGVTGTLLLNGSYISAKAAPNDFDVLLIGPPDIQAMKDADPALAALLDAEQAENEGGYSLFYTGNDSPALPMLLALWDETKTGERKGCIEVTL